MSPVVGGGFVVEASRGIGGIFVEGSVLHRETDKRFWGQGDFAGLPDDGADTVGSADRIAIAAGEEARNVLEADVIEADAGIRFNRNASKHRNMGEEQEVERDWPGVFS